MIFLGPIEHHVHSIAFAMKEGPEHLPDVVVIGSILVSEGASVGEEQEEFLGEAFTEFVEGSADLAFGHDLIFLEFRVGPDAEPGQVPRQEGDQHVSQRLQIVPSGLLDPQVCAHRRITRRPYQRLPFYVRYVLVVVASVPARKPKVYQMHYVRPLSSSHHKVSWLNISMDESSTMELLQAHKHLIGQHQDSLQAEPAPRTQLTVEAAA